MTLIPFSLEKRGGTIEYGHSVFPERYWDKVIPEPTSGCWIWIGSLNKKGGHPYFCMNNKVLSPRQYISREVYGMTDKERVVRTCETIVCLNPAHWVIIPKGMCNRGHDGPKDSYGNCNICSNMWNRENKWKYAEQRRKWEREYDRKRRANGWKRPKRDPSVSVFGDKPPENVWRPSAPGW